ncbi:hypothetical protein [Acidovorax sp.]|uniref:DUF5983 family protein n=1 Tax=Acidovorax sp. TaxID=1872122 RepID=UPI00391FA51F
MTEQRTPLTGCPIEQLAEISSGHVPYATAVALGEDPKQHDKSALYNHLAYTPWADYGWIIFCSVEAALAVKDEHPELAHLIDICVEARAFWLKLDTDGPLIDGLPSFDWKQSHSGNDSL